MLLDNTTFWLIGFYIFSALSLVFFLWLMKIIHRSKFRSEEGDTTYEIGYEEDPQGRVVEQELGGKVTGGEVSDISVSEYYHVGPM